MLVVHEERLATAQAVQIAQSYQRRYRVTVAQQLQGRISRTQLIPRWSFPVCVFVLRQRTE